MRTATDPRRGDAIIVLWAAWPRLRAWIEQPKYDVLIEIREYEDAETKRPSE